MIKREVKVCKSGKIYPAHGVNTVNERVRRVGCITVHKRVHYGAQDRLKNLRKSISGIAQHLRELRKKICAIQKNPYRENRNCAAPLSGACELRANCARFFL